MSACIYRYRPSKQKYKIHSLSIDLIIIMEPRKRSRITETSHSSSPTTTTTTSPPSLTSYYHTSTSTPNPSLLLSQITNLQAEIERETSLRRLDQIKSQNTEKRLKRHIISLEQDLTESNGFLEQFQQESEESLEGLRVARSTAETVAREWEERYRNLVEERNGGGGDGDGETKKELELVMREKELVEKRLEAALQHVNSLQSRVVPNTPTNNVQSEDQPEHNTNTQTPTKDPPTTPTLAISPAPLAVMTELNRTRVQYSDSQRQVRQLERTVSNLQKVAHQTIQYRERSKRAEAMVETLEKEKKGW